MLALRRSKSLVAVVVVTALLFMPLIPIVNAGPDVFRQLTTKTKVYSEATGELCWVDTREYPPRADTNTTHYQDFHDGQTTNHTHIYVTINSIHHYTDSVPDCSAG